MARAYVCMKISEYPPPPLLGRRRTQGEHFRVETYEESKQRFQRKADDLLKQGGSDSEVIICLDISRSHSYRKLYIM